MPDLNGILGIGKEALLAHQKAIDVTGHNIANANTPGYSRQRVNMETREPISVSPGQMGTGVRAQEIQRVYDRFWGVQINNENQSLGRWEAQKGAFQRVEMIFDESTGYGLNQAMSEFWNSWHDLTNNPSGSAERVALLDKSEKLADNFNKIYTDLENIRKDLDQNIKGTTEEINLIADQIADLNQKISQTEVGGQNANDYRDERDLLLTHLSTMININSFENSDGKVTVLMGGGRPLVENVASWHLSTQPDASGLQNIVLVDSEGQSNNVMDNISGGKLKGWIDVRDVVIPGYLTRLDNLSIAIMDEVNSIHQTGYGLTADPDTGYPFTNIDFFSGSSASDMEVNSEIADDINKIAASGNSVGVPGDNSNAIAIANLQTELAMNDNTATFDDYYNSLVSNVGGGVQKASINYDHQSAIISHLDNYQQATSGVSLDEEMVNLVKFQHAYDAAAKLIVTVDEMMQAVINLV